MEIGAGWLKPKKDKEGAEVLVQGRKVLNISFQIEIPFLGKLNGMLIRESDKKNDKAPDYRILWFGEDKREKEIGPAANGKSKNAQQKYQNDIAEVFRRIIDSMHPKGRLIVVANDSNNLYGNIADSLDVDVENIIQRHVNRRTGRRSTEFYESIFIWCKQ